MVCAKLIRVEVAYALPEKQHIFAVDVVEESTIETVIEKSGVLLLFSEIDLTKQKVGIFSKIKKLTEKVKEGDRIEIYRHLLVDPKEARRIKAKKSSHNHSR